MPSTAAAESKASLGYTNPFPIQDFMRWSLYEFSLYLHIEPNDYEPPAPSLLCTHVAGSSPSASVSLLLC